MLCVSIQEPDKALFLTGQSSSVPRTKAIQAGRKKKYLQWMQKEKLYNNFFLKAGHH